MLKILSSFLLILSSLCLANVDVITTSTGKIDKELLLNMELIKNMEILEDLDFLVYFSDEELRSISTNTMEELTNE